MTSKTLCRLLLILLTFLATPRAAAKTLASDLVSSCEAALRAIETNKIIAPLGDCPIYMSALKDILMISITQKSGKNISIVRADGDICTPDEIGVIDLMKIFVDYLKVVPGELAYPAAIVVVHAWKDKFRCQ